MFSEAINQLSSSTVSSDFIVTGILFATKGVASCWSCERMQGELQ